MNTVFAVERLDGTVRLSQAVCTQGEFDGFAEGDVRECLAGPRRLLWKAQQGDRRILWFLDEAA